jgi:multidrug resistance efflux pump
MDEAETARALAEAEHKHAAEIVKRLTIHSPINGVVVDRLLSPGEYVETTPILKVAEIDSLNVEVILPSSYYRSIKVGTKATVIPENPVGGQYTATVSVIDRVSDAASGTFGVRLKLPNPRFKIPAGIRCKVLFP